ncbi:MAG: cation:proton antiporter, partial [Bacteroidota bacterium]
LARTAVPWLLERVTRTRQPELFLLAVVAVCMGTAALMSLAGVSVALGAFFAGLVASESRYADQALSEMLPLRTIFSAVFFVSVGMLLDVSFLISNLPLVLLVAVVVVMLKAATTVGSVLALGLPVRVAGAVGLTLAQVGEFSFVLERAGREAGLSPAGFGETGEQVFIASTVLLMMLTPLMSSLGPSFGRLLERTPLHRVGPQKEMEEEEVLKLEDHVVIVGYGPAGRRLVQVLQNTGIPFAVIDINPANVTELQEQGLPALYGDASRALILEHVGILRAKVLAVAINDTGAVPRVIAQAHHMNPTLQIIARTRYLADAEKLQSRGADLVVPEEMETTVRMFSHVLGAYLVPKEEIERQVQSIRAEDYGIVRGGLREAHLMVLQGLDEDGLHTRAVAVRDGAPAAGQTLADLQLRNEFGITVLAVRRGRRTIGSPAGDFLVEPNDRLVLLGSAENFAEAGEVFREPATE